MYIVNQRQEKNQLNGFKKAKTESICLGRLHLGEVACCDNSQPC